MIILINLLIAMLGAYAIMCAYRVGFNPLMIGNVSDKWKQKLYASSIRALYMLLIVILLAVFTAITSCGSHKYVNHRKQCKQQLF